MANKVFVGKRINKIFEFRKAIKEMFGVFG